ncbi:MAG: SpoIID/LytB domain-containing protein [Paludibacteraceae bacterium]|nr:SpoIID/LytB domain-containing protein [Paludibacteraceae bacterium]
MNIRVGIMTAPSIRWERRAEGVLLHDVRIGIGFHWDRREDQLFEGTMEIRDNADGTQTAINTLDVEDYLTSVITSEMSATSSLELLKAHAVISRSWVLRPMIEKRPLSCTPLPVVVGTPTLKEGREGYIDTPERRIVWYERDAHVGFDVCADDHCQRYEGITRRDAHPEASARVRAAVEATRGLVLVDPTDGDAICDTRFYKCCGGRTELFENAWAPRHYSYLESVACPYCNTKDARVLSQVLNNYDQETQDFYRWTVRYTADELASIIHDRSGIDFGEIHALHPLKRGPSGRIYELEIVGSRHRMVVGKELEIRKWLSRSHLYSSAFDVTREGTDFVLRGRGWGHGVGLCQIGAAVMADKGFTYEQILAHYFPGSRLKRLA